MSVVRKTLILLCFKKYRYLTSSLYEHEFNQFTVKPSDITEDMIKKNPMSYMDYIAPVEKTDAEKLADAENSITELQLALVELCESIGV